MAKRHHARSAQARSSRSRGPGLDRHEGLEKDRTRRYETANALAADIRRGSLRTSPSRLVLRAAHTGSRKWFDATRPSVASSAGIVVALVIGLSLSLFLFIRERRALHEEKAARQRAIAAEKQQALLREQAEKGLAIERRMREMAPLGDKLNQAGMLLSQGLFDKAEEMVKDLPLIIPGSCSIFNVIGDQHGRRGQWEQAIRSLICPFGSIRLSTVSCLSFACSAPGCHKVKGCSTSL